MNDVSHLRKLLQTLDAGDDTTPPPFADELWGELDAAFDAAANMPLDPAPEEIEILTELETDAPRRSWQTRGVFAGAAAAAIVVLALVGLWWLPDSGNDRTITADSDDVEVVSPEQPCARYRAVEPSVADLAAALAAGQPVEVDDVRAIRAAIDELRQDLEAMGGASRAALDRYAAASNLLSQVEIEVDRELFAQAGRTLERAQEAIELENPVDNSDPQPDQCTTP